MPRGSKSRRPRRAFTDEFKAGAARLVIEGERPIREVARDLDLTESTLRTWVERARVAGTNRAVAAGTTAGIGGGSGGSRGGVATSPGAAPFVGELAPGFRLGTYEIETTLGAGGFATVYRARHVFLGTHHAVKVLDPQHRRGQTLLPRFLDEAKIQGRHLDHPNIVKVTDYLVTEGHAALVMELVNGRSLDSCLDELRDRPQAIKEIMLGVLAGVGHAHAAGIVHRDLKPANVLLQQVGQRQVAKVTDFGIAKLSSDIAAPQKKSTHGNVRMGTPAYMSPEQIRRAKDATVRSDIWSLGAMLYELVIGDLPFAGDGDYVLMENIVHGRYVRPQQRRASVDPVLAAVIEKALRVDPAERFASCEQMAAALRGELSLAEPLAERGPPPVPQVAPAPLKAAIEPVRPAPSAHSVSSVEITVSGPRSLPAYPVASYAPAPVPTPGPSGWEIAGNVVIGLFKVIGVVLVFMLALVASSNGKGSGRSRRRRRW